VSWGLEHKKFDYRCLTSEIREEILRISHRGMPSLKAELKAI